MITGAYSLVWTRWYPINLSKAMLPHKLAVFAVDSTLVNWYDLRPIYDTTMYNVQERWNVT